MVILCHAKHLLSIKTQRNLKKVFLFYRWLSFFEKMRQKKIIDKIRVKSYSVHGSLVECQLPIRGCVCSSPGKCIIFKLGLSLQKMRQNVWKKSAKTWMCAYFQIEPKTLIVYSVHSSLVERQLSIMEGAWSSPGNYIIFKLRLPPSQDENAGM